MRRSLQMRRIETMKQLPGRITALLFVAAALSACTSTQDVLEPSAIAAQQSGATTGAISTNARVQIAPIVGASVEAATPLPERLAVRARERGVRLAGSADATATHV